MTLLQSKGIFAMFVDWASLHPVWFFSMAFLVIFTLIHFEGLLPVRKHKPIPKTIDLWSVQETEPMFKNLNHDKLTQAETKLGYRLPDLLVEQLLEKNGGATKRLSYKVKGNAYLVVGDSKIFINSLLGINCEHNQSECLDILSSLFFWETKNLPKGLVVIAEVGSAWLLLDYNDSKSEPSVKYWNPSIQNGIKVASSWESFCAKLYPLLDEVK